MRVGRAAWRVALGLCAVGIVLGVVTLSGGSAAIEQETGDERVQMLQEMWERPYVTMVLPAAPLQARQRTTMLWNAMNDDPHADMHSSMQALSGNDGYGDGSSGDDSSEDGGSESYEKFDTSSDSGGDSTYDSDLKSIIPSSERQGTSLEDNQHEWDTPSLSNNDDWDAHSGSDGGSSDDGGENQSWLKTHSWESGRDANLKADIKKMYHNGINKISKSIAKEAEQENKNNFFSKWAGGKSAAPSKSSLKTPLSSSDMKLYKEAEHSVKKEEEKKAPLIKAAEKADKQASAADSGKKAGGGGAAGGANKVKAKLEAADRLSSSLAKKDAKKTHKTSVKDLLKESARIAVESKHAKGSKAKKEVEARAQELQREIKEDFSHATAIADGIRHTAAKLVGSKLKAPKGLM